jgi:hypothetical protein
MVRSWGIAVAMPCPPSVGCRTRVRLAVDVHKRPNGTHESLTPETHNVGASAARVAKHCIKPRFAPGVRCGPGRWRPPPTTAVRASGPVDDEPEG